MAPRGKAPGSRRLLVGAAEVAAAPGARASGSGSWPRLALRLHLYLINAGGCRAALTLDVLVLGERLQPLGTGSFIPPAFQLFSSLCLLPDSGSPLGLLPDTFCLSQLPLTGFLLSFLGSQQVLPSQGTCWSAPETSSCLSLSWFLFCP